MPGERGSALKGGSTAARFCPQNRYDHLSTKFGKGPIFSTVHPFLSTFFVPGFVQTKLLKSPRNLPPRENTYSTMPDFVQETPGHTRFCPLPYCKLKHTRADLLHATGSHFAEHCQGSGI